MTHRTRLTLLPTCLLALLPALTLADGLADRYHDNRHTQMMDPITSIHQTMGPAAAGPAQQRAIMIPEQPVAMPSRYPANVKTAHQKKRYLFDSNQF